MRHTFITSCRNGGALAEVVEKITHNASGDIIDQYTHFAWDPLCAAVLCLTLVKDQNLDPNLDQAPKTPAFVGENGWRRRESLFPVRRPAGSHPFTRRPAAVQERQMTGAALAWSEQRWRRRESNPGRTIFEKPKPNADLTFMYSKSFEIVPADPFRPAPSRSTAGSRVTAT
jgi:hypothetical protein